MSQAEPFVALQTLILYTASRTLDCVRIVVTVFASAFQVVEEVTLITLITLQRPTLCTLNTLINLAVYAD